MNFEVHHPLQSELSKKAKIFELDAFKQSLGASNFSLLENAGNITAQIATTFPAEIPAIIAETNKKILEVLREQFEKITLDFNEQVC